MIENSVNKPKINIYWVRRDFRLIDNPALSAAAKSSKQESIPLLPIFILDPQILSPESAKELNLTVSHQNVGYPRKKLLSRILTDFKKNLAQLQILIGNPKDVFEALCEEYQISLFINQDLENYARMRDFDIKRLVLENGGKFFEFEDQLITNKETRAGSGNLYSVFTPFKKAIWESFVNFEPVPKPILDCPFFDQKNFQSLIKTNSFSILDKAHQELEQEIFRLIDTPWVFSSTTKSHRGQDTFEINLDDIFYRQNYNPVLTNEIQSIAYFLGYLKAGKMDGYKKNRDDLGLDLQTWQGIVTFEELQAMGCDQIEIHQSFDFYQQKPENFEQNFELIEGSVKVNGLGQTSLMSTSLKWGTITPKILIKMLKSHYQDPFKNPFSGPESPGHYISELVWREFYRYIQYHHPETQNTEFQTKFRGLDVSDTVSQEIFIETANSIIKKLS